jgi:RNA polymerase sigma-70 factor (ECF subfamily)
LAVFEGVSHEAPPQAIERRIFVTSTAGDAVAVQVASQAEQADPAARLGALFDAHHARLYRLARRLSSRADDARDLVQETFLRAARSPASVPFGAASEEAWLVRVLINVCRDGWRKRTVRSRVDPVHAIDAMPRAPSNQEAALIARTDLWRALGRLAPRRRAILVLYELEGTAIPAIAKLLGVAPVTVRWHLSCGRRELARVIKGETGDVS